MNNSYLQNKLFQSTKHETTKYKDDQNLKVKKAIS